MEKYKITYRPHVGTPTKPSQSWIEKIKAVDGLHSIDTIDRQFKSPGSSWRTFPVSEIVFETGLRSINEFIAIESVLNLNLSRKIEVNVVTKGKNNFASRQPVDR